ncbi:glutamate receptor ionotropic, kainate 2 isoform X2 [Episyrphus balteatus]|uniref:glutamate receptor ionotropic, kainate 2 isoform X2 n=1 Tax=Episyrphus balteatus TaxID=286459 RepID=UPI002486C41B|nr:glutamate receptor ionotropic, kainate 2 isoform X2 [Episyrphus balteatus]
MLKAKGKRFEFLVLATKVLVGLLFELLWISEVSLLPSVVRIGGIFNEDQIDSPAVLAFKYAVHNINRDKGILPHTALEYDIQYISKNDSFRASKKVCSQINLGVHAIFGPSDAVSRAHIHSICDALDIPHLESRIDVENRVREFSINLHPSQYYVNTAFQDVIRYLNWTKIGVLFEKHCGLIQLRELIRSSGIEMHIREVEPSTYIHVLNEFKNKEINNIVIDTSTTNISFLLKGILQLQMNEYKYHYLFTSFDIETFELDDFKYNFVNITAFRLVDTGDVSVKEVLKDMELFNQLNIRDQEVFRKDRIIETEPALIYDSVYIFALGLQTLDLSHTLNLSNLSCSEANPWDGGLSLINYINSVEWKGLTGPIQFKEGQRIQFKLDLVKLKQHSIVKVGEWSPQTRLNITDRSKFFESGSINVTLVVITILETPYVMMRYGKNFTGNERFYGFCVDILDLVARETGFDYILDLVPDRKYGAKDPISGEWNGMVAQLMKYKADLAVGSMTINYARESVIDFTKPFMNLGISILFKDSMIETYRKMWRFMENRKPSVFTTTYEEGIKRVLEGNYAFLMESTMLDYIVQRDCNLTQIGGLLDAKGYGIATPMGSPWRDKISLTILELQEKGEIQMLYDKWWKNAGETCLRKDKSKQSKANALGLDNIGGVFVVLVCGLIIAVCMSIYEFRQHNKKISSVPGNAIRLCTSDGDNQMTRGIQQTLCEEMATEFCFALRCMGPRQRPALSRKCSKCTSLAASSDFIDNNEIYAKSRKYSSVHRKIQSSNYRSNGENIDKQIFRTPSKSFSELSATPMPVGCQNE